MSQSVSPPSFTAANGWQPLFRPHSEMESELAVPVGTEVKVNHYKGIVRAVHTHIAGTDRKTEAEFLIPLRSMLYEVEIDTTQKLKWAVGTRQVFCPDETTSLRLFRDEFEVLRLPVPLPAEP